MNNNSNVSKKELYDLLIMAGATVVATIYLAAEMMGLILPLEPVLRGVWSNVLLASSIMVIQWYCDSESGFYQQGYLQVLCGILLVELLLYASVGAGMAGAFIILLYTQKTVDGGDRITNLLLTVFGALGALELDGIVRLAKAVEATQIIEKMAMSMWLDVALLFTILVWIGWKRFRDKISSKIIHILPIILSGLIYLGMILSDANAMFLGQIAIVESGVFAGCCAVLLYVFVLEERELEDAQKNNELMKYLFRQLALGMLAMVLVTTIYSARYTMESNRVREDAKPEVYHPMAEPISLTEAVGNHFGIDDKGLKEDYGVNKLSIIGWAFRDGIDSESVTPRIVFYDRTEDIYYLLPGHSMIRDDMDEQYGGDGLYAYCGFIGWVDVGVLNKSEYEVYVLYQGAEEVLYETGWVTK